MIPTWVYGPSTRSAAGIRSAPPSSRSRTGILAASSSFDPSSGGTGIMLNSARYRLSRTPCAAKLATAGFGVGRGRRHRREHHREHHVARRTRQRDQRQPVQTTPQLRGIRVHRLAPSQESRAQQRRHGRKQHRADPVHMRQWIESDAAFAVAACRRPVWSRPRRARIRAAWSAATATPRWSELLQSSSFQV